MTELGQDVGLVGRADVVELVEYLVERDARRRLPVIVAYGPGGSGKTALVAHLERRYDANTPLAKVELTQDNSKTSQDVLDAVFVQLCREAHRRFGRLRLPRYEAARIIRDCALETVVAPNPHAVIRARLSEQLTTLSGFVEALREAGEVAGGVSGFVGRFLRPVTRWMISASVVAPQPLRWLLAGPKGAAAFRWYERKAHEYLHGLAKGVHVDSVGAHIHGLINDEPVSDGARDQLNAFMVAALLADLRAEYRFRGARKTNCVVLLDNADLLSPDEAELWAVSGAHRSPPRGKDFLDLVAEELDRHPDTPLLLIGTKQASPAADGFGNDAFEAGAGASRGGRAAAPYQRWLRDQVRGGEKSAQSHSSGYLPVRLDRLTLDETRQLLRELSELNKQTVHTEARVREIHEATHGHPHAVQLVSKKLRLRSAKNSTAPSVRSIFDELARPEEGHADPHETVREYLLMRFLQRFRTEPLPAELSSAALDGDEAGDQGRAVRGETTELLSRLAAPLWLTESTVELLASDRDEQDVQRIKDYLGILSFVTAGEDDTWSLHPLLRDLLVKELVVNEAGSGFSYEEIHRKLANHYARQLWDPGSQLALHYHLLALAEVQEVAKHFAERAKQAKTDQQWQTDLERIARAPQVRPGTRSQLREWLHTGAVLVDAPRSRQFEQLIVALCTLWSCTGGRRWDERSLGQLDDALRSIARSSDLDVHRWRRRYSRMAMGSEHVAVQPLPTVLRAQGRYTYPAVLWPRHGIRRFVAGTLALAMVGYGASYLTHVNSHCDRGGLGSLEAVQWLWDDSRTLVNLGGECIGIGTGVGSFSGPPLRNPHDAAPAPHEAEIVALTALIDKQNKEVERRRAQEGKPYATVVVPTILSTREEQPRNGLAVGVNELRGAVLAQQEWNDPAGPRRFYVRLAVANAGGAFAHAETVAQKIRQLMLRDPTVIGVSGLSQTRDETEKAVGVLGRADAGAGSPPVPMVSSQASGNELSHMPYFFRIAVPNRGQAQAGTTFLASQQNGQRKPFVLSDDDDSYSRELADNYDAELRTRIQGWQPPVRLRYTTRAVDLRSEMADEIRTMCDQTKRGPAPLLIYTGRANETVPMLQELSQSDCGRDTLILGSDDLAQLDTHANSYLSRLQGLRDDQFLFTTYSISSALDLNNVDVDPRVKTNAQAFFDTYDKAMPQVGAAPGEAFWTRPNGHVVDAYDALRLLLTAAERGTPGSSSLPIPSQVHAGLCTTTGNNAYYGAGGKTDFGGCATPHFSGDPQKKLVAVNRIAGIGRDVHIEHVDAIAIE